jgi:two-component system, cell cycle sensor histidine kinase and response regulator CckA
VTTAVFESFFAHCREGLCVIDAEGVIRHANTTLRIVLGCDEQDVVGRPVSTLLHPEDRERVAGELRTLTERHARGTIDARWRVFRGFRWLSWQVDPHGDMLFCRLRAVTMGDEPLVQSVCEALPSPIFVLQENGTCVLCNDAYGRLVGRPPAELVGSNLADAPFSPELRDALQTHARGVIQTGAPALLKDGTLATPDGRSSAFQIRMVSVHVRGEAVALAVAEDVTERRAAESALARSEASFRRLIERAPDAIFVHRGGIVVYANAVAASILGYADPAELLDLPFREVVAAEDRPSIDDLCASPRELRMVRQDAAILQLEATVHTVDFDAQEAMLVFARDITEQQRMQARLQHADRMVSIGTLAAGVAHEVNNPLSYVLANLDHARRTLAELAELADAAAMRERLTELAPMLEDAETGAQRVRGIVGDLSTFSTPTDETRRPLDVRTVLDAALQMANNEIRHRAELEKDYGDVPLVLGSDSRLAQVFLNLLVNAVHALPERGKNRLRVVTATSPAGAAVIEVHDSGVGIEAAQLARVFDPFYTTKPVGGGMGLGLSICHAIVEAHGGTIELESAVGEGTIARITLPAATPLSRPRVIAAAPAGVASRLRILVVDDEAAIGRVLVKMLGREHATQMVQSGEAALELLAREAFDVVFCDLMMPRMGGDELYRRAVAAHPSCADAFVFMTGGAFTQGARAFLAGVPNAVIGKPFDFGEIRRIVAELAANSPTSIE